MYPTLPGQPSELRLLSVATRTVRADMVLLVQQVNRLEATQHNAAVSRQFKAALTRALEGGDE